MRSDLEMDQWEAKNPPATAASPSTFTAKPIQIPDEWVTWEGKEQGQPRPPIIWYGEIL